jgi:hypothetical protein
MSVSYPEETIAEMGWRLLSSDRLADSSVMFRADAARQAGGFDLTYRHAQDYDLWVRMSRTSGVARLREVLLELRIHRASASVQFSEPQSREVASIIQRSVNRILSVPVDLATGVVVHRVLSESVGATREDVCRCLGVLDATVEPFCRANGVGADERASVRAASFETTLKLVFRHRRALGLSAVSLLAKACAKSPTTALRPSTLVRWISQGSRARRYRQAIRALSNPSISPS